MSNQWPQQPDVPADDSQAASSPASPQSHTAPDYGQPVPQGAPAPEPQQYPQHAYEQQPYPSQPPTQPGYGQQPYDPQAYSQQPYDPQAYPQQGYDPQAYPQQGYAQPGYGQQAYAQPPADPSGYPAAGYAQPGYGQPGAYAQAGWDQQAYSAEPAKRSSLLGTIALAVVAIAALIVVVLGYQFGAMFGGLVGQIGLEATAELDPTDPRVAALGEQLGLWSLGITFATAIGAAAWITGIVAFVKRMGRTPALWAIILGVLAPIAGFIAMVVAIMPYVS